MAVSVGPDLPPVALSFCCGVHECRAVLGVWGVWLPGRHLSLCLIFTLRAAWSSASGFRSSSSSSGRTRDWTP